MIPQERPLISEPTGITFGKIIASIKMVLTPGKCHYLLLGNRSNSDTINLNGTKLASSSYEKLLGILIDRDLSFDKHKKHYAGKQAKN